jgi:hypothetical protein
MGVLAPGSGHARPSAQPPIDVSRSIKLLSLIPNTDLGLRYLNHESG